MADIRDCDRIEEIITACKPTRIIHAAAHKHVGLMEIKIDDNQKEFGLLDQLLGE